MGYEFLLYDESEGIATIDAEEALRLGLVSKVVPPDQLQAATLRIARRVARVPAYAVQLTKRSIKGAYEKPEEK